MTIKNDFTKHRVFVQRLAATELKNIKSFLNNLQERAKSEIMAGSANLKSLKQNLRDSVKGLANTSLDNLTDVAKYEARFTERLLNKYYKEVDIKTPTVSKLERTVRTKNMSVTEGSAKKSLTVAYKQFANKKADEVAQIIKDGRINNLNPKEISDNINNRIKGLHTSQARVLATTAINYSTNVGKSQVLYENHDIIRFVQWNSVLDSGTCDYCEDQSNQVYQQGLEPSCPAHWMCRCELVPYE